MNLEVGTAQSAGFFATSFVHLIRTVLWKAQPLLSPKCRCDAHACMHGLASPHRGCNLCCLPLWLILDASHFVFSGKASAAACWGCLDDLVVAGATSIYITKAQRQAGSGSCTVQSRYACLRLVGCIEQAASECYRRGTVFLNHSPMTFGFSYSSACICLHPLLFEKV